MCDVGRIGRGWDGAEERERGRERERATGRQTELGPPSLAVILRAAAYACASFTHGPPWLLVAFRRRMAAGQAKSRQCNAVRCSKQQGVRDRVRVRAVLSAMFCSVFVSVRVWRVGVWISWILPHLPSNTISHCIAVRTAEQSIAEHSTSQEDGSGIDVGVEQEEGPHQRRQARRPPRDGTDGRCRTDRHRHGILPCNGHALGASVGVACGCVTYTPAWPG